MRVCQMSRLEGCHAHNTLFWRKDLNSIRRAAAGATEQGPQAVPEHHRGARAQLLANIVKGRIDVELTLRAGTQSLGVQQLGTSRAPSGRRAPCWTTFASGAHLGKGMAQRPQVAKEPQC